VRYSIWVLTERSVRLTMQSPPQTVKATSAPTRKDRILATSVSSFATYGFRGVSIGDVAKACDVSKSTVLHHFKSKAGLYKAVLETVNAALSDIALNDGATRASPRERVRDVIGRVVSWAKEQDDHACIIVNELIELRSREQAPPSWSLAPALLKLREEIVRGQQAGVVHEEDPYAILEIIFAAAIYRSINRAYRRLSFPSDAPSEPAMESAVVSLLERAVLR
jgi:AcrR family transcriptional regulator